MSALSLAYYDAIRDDIKAAYLTDPGVLPECQWVAFACLGTIAQTGAGPDSVLAAQCLERMALRAKSGVPMYEPQEEVL